MIGTLFLIGMSVFVGYSMWLTISAIRADRSGDIDRADALRTRGVLLRLGVGFGLTFLMIALVFIFEAIG